jgi:hypothetical protein
MSGTCSSGFLFADPYELALMSIAFKEENPFLMTERSRCVFGQEESSERRGTKRDGLSIRK